MRAPEFGIVQRRVTVLIADFQTGLAQQCVQGSVDGMPHIMVLAVVSQVGGPQAHREQRAFQGVHDIGKRLARRKIAAAQARETAPVPSPRCGYRPVIERLSRY